MLIRINENKVILLGIFGITVLGLIGFPDAQAASMTFTVNTTISTDQTILSAEVWHVNPGVTLSIDPGVTVTINDGGIILNAGNINNSGTISISNSNLLGTGIYIDSNGTLSNLSTGIITMSNSNGDGITNIGVLSNLGSITVSTTGGFGIFNGGTLDNSGIINLYNSGVGTDSGIDNKNTVNNNSGGVITVSNVSGYGIGNGIDPNFIINNYGTIIVNGTAFDGIVTYGTINNYGAITITSSRIYHNTGDINNSGTITVSPPGVLVNNGQIYDLCGGSYFGPTLNRAIIDNCLPCTPPLGNWSITSSCTMNTSATANGNIIVQNGVVLTIPNGITLTIPIGSNITIPSGGGLLIEFGGIVIVVG